MTTTAEPIAFSLGGLKKKKPAGSKTEHPTLPDPDGSIGKSVAILCDAKAKLDQLAGTIRTHESDLKTSAQVFAFSKRDTPGSVEAVAPNGAKCLITLKNAYSAISVDDARVTGLRKLMGDRFEAVMDHGFTISIDSSKIPPDEIQPFIDTLSSIAEMHDCVDAVSYKEFVKPKKSFHLERCNLFNTGENHSISKFMPVQIALKAKGVQ